ncbi:MAG: MFS transporter [Candidatus Aenigmarchaeota archaeon]|nr:MFS transporter [Candidatus Aenigmarchaeota archaeon]
MNRTIKLLMIADIFFLTGFGLISPILAIYIKDNLAGGTIFTAGLASALFLVTKSAIQLPFSKYVDKSDDKVRLLVIGTVVASTVPFIYIFADNIIYVYVAEIVAGIGAGFSFPTWLGLWSTNLDKGHESYEWSLYSTLTGVGTAATAAIGAAIAEFIGFKYTFLFVGVMALASCFILFQLETKGAKIVKKTDYKYAHEKTPTEPGLPVA